jgi:hypothetical protein
MGASFGAEYWMDNPGGALVKIGEPTNVKPPFYSSDSLDRTSHSSPNAIAQAMPSGVTNISPGTVTILLEPGSAEDVMLHDAAKTRRVGTHKFVIPGDTPQAFSGEGWVSSYEPGDADPKGQMTAVITVTPTGEFIQADDA